MLVPALAVAGCDRQAAPDSQAKVCVADSGLKGKLDIANRGEEIPDFTVTDPSGRSLKLRSLKGKPVLLNLWATWCGPCVLEMPMLEKMATDYEGKLRVLTVSQDIEGATKVAPLFAEKKFSKLEPWLDPENNLGFKYNTGMLPTTVLYDKDGKEVWRMIGAHDWCSPRTAAMISETLDK